MLLLLLPLSCRSESCSSGFGEDKKLTCSLRVPSAPSRSPILPPLESTVILLPGRLQYHTSEKTSTYSIACSEPIARTSPILESITGLKHAFSFITSLVRVCHILGYNQTLRDQFLMRFLCTWKLSTSARRSHSQRW